jgi:hypothetical protein
MEAPKSQLLRVLVLAPIGRDAGASVDLLQKDGLVGCICGSLSALVAGSRRVREPPL